MEQRHKSGVAFIYLVPQLRVLRAQPDQLPAQILDVLVLLLFQLMDAELAEYMYTMAAHIFSTAESRYSGQFSFRLLDSIYKFIRVIASDGSRRTEAVNACYEALDFFELQEGACPGIYRSQKSCLEALLNELRSARTPTEYPAQSFFPG